MTRFFLRKTLAGVQIFFFMIGTVALATIPPRSGVSWPQSYLQRIRTQPRAFTYSRALTPMVARIQANRAAVARGDITPDAAMAVGGTSVSGTRAIPVLMASHANTSVDPYPVSNLQTELFDGPWPTGTMTQYYQEVSYGNFTVTGTVFNWEKLPQNDTFYEGPPGCNGLCGAGKTGQLLKDTLDLNDVHVDFGQYDNDGPDGLPNSGDDDGYVDFVAFVHPESGGECGNSNIWSHRWIYSGWTGADYVTNDPKSGGGSIRVDDYVIMPALACDNTTMIQIGVFAHEFGHAFGLPDLYDTNPDNGDSEGLGNWCLMAGGSWGGDGTSPETPTHMSAWAKEYLGWVNPTIVGGDLEPAAVPNIEETSQAFKIAINANEYFLVSNRQKKLFDSRIPEAGLLIWHINQSVVNAGLANNSVNADENNKGVDLEEADGLDNLDKGDNRGDAGDVFPGSQNKRRFDRSSIPASSGSFAVCEISSSDDPMTASLLVTRDLCEPGGCSALPGSGSRTNGPQAVLLWIILLSPLAVPVVMSLRNRHRCVDEAFR